MKPATHTVNELFERDVRYLVPLFQRPYVWQRDNQWEPLWNDICVLLEHQLAHDEPTSVPSHFLGAIVLEQEDVFVPGSIPAYTVIDGQQRLTTLQILLAATAESLEEAGAGDDADLLRELVRNNPRKAKGEGVHKVWPTNVNRAAFVAVMGVGGPPPDREDDPHNRIDEAYAYFRERTAEWLAGDDHIDTQLPVAERALLLRVTLVDLLKVVSITLESGDNAQVIFETLNARGTPLLALDLVKNAVFRAASRAGGDVDSLYESRWRPQLDDAYWRQERVQGRLKRPRGELFLMHWLAMKLARVIPATELFSVFRRDVLRGSTGDAVRPLIDELCRDARIMRSFDSLPAGSPEARFFSRLDVLDTSTLLPLALLLFRDAELSPTRRRRALAALESWLVRRALMRMTAQAYNRDVPRLLVRVGADPARADRVIIEHLRGAAGQASRWPGDEEFTAFLSERPVYGLVARRRLLMVLAAVEEATHGRKTELLSVDSLSLEHVMPQKWRDNWPLPAGVDEREAESRRTERIHRLGNLTVTSVSLNAALSNAAWDRKQRELMRHTRLFLNADLVERYGDGFAEAEIDERSAWLADCIRRLWPGPDDLVWDRDDEYVPPQVTRLTAASGIGRREAGHASGRDTEVGPPTEDWRDVADELPSEDQREVTEEVRVAEDRPAQPSSTLMGWPFRHSSTYSVDSETAMRIARVHHEGERLTGQALNARFGLDQVTTCQALYWAEPVVYPHIRLQPIPEDIVAAREGLLPRSRLIDGEPAALRWERIAQRAGITPQEARRLYDVARGPGAAKRSYTGRGRRFEGMD